MLNLTVNLRSVMRHIMMLSSPLFILMILASCTAIQAQPLTTDDNSYSDIFNSVPEFEIIIDRNMTCLDNSTIGRLIIDGKDIGRSLELPWKNNQSNISRIPEGSYPGFIRSDGKRGWRIQLKGVPDREFVQIHVGNYQRQIEGCILVGTDVTNVGNECMVTNSKTTLNNIRAKFEQMSSDLANLQSREVRITVTVK